jgi:lipooligosaccharide transport system ATP-binding protein
MSGYALNIKGLNKSFGSIKAVDDLHFSVEKSECFGLLGPNGAGKTTTMKMLYGKVQPDITEETEIDIFGFSPLDRALEIKAFSGIVPQQDNLDSQLSVWDNLLVYSKFYGMTKNEAHLRINELLEFMELKERKDVNTRELSGGMQRRLVIARALLNRPKLLFLDEPTTGLDPQVRHLIWDKLRELRDSGVTIILTTHYMEEAFQICNRIIIMDKARKILEGKPKELISKNMEKFVMEIPGMKEPARKCLKYFDENSIRYEIFKDTLYAYSSSYDNLRAYTDISRNEDIYIRHTHLEDLFLKVTGRSLNELQ